MRMKAPDDSGVDVGGQHFSVVGGFIDVPDDFTSSGVDALTACGFALVIAAAPVAPTAPVVADAPRGEA